MMHVRHHPVIRICIVCEQKFVDAKETTCSSACEARKKPVSAPVEPVVVFVDIEEQERLERADSLTSTVEEHTRKRSREWMSNRPAPLRPRPSKAIANGVRAEVLADGRRRAGT